MKEEKKEPTNPATRASGRGKSISHSSFTTNSTDKLLMSGALSTAKSRAPNPTASLKIAKQIALGVVIGLIVGIAFVSAPSSRDPHAPRTAAISPQAGNETVTPSPPVDGNSSSSPLGFQYITERDAFTGIILPSIQNRNAAGQTIAITRPNQNQSELNGNIAFLMDPDGYICPSASDGKVLIEHLIVVNGLTKPLGSIRWDVSQSRKAFLLKSGFYSDHIYNAIRNAEEIRFRFTDECHETKTLVFQLKNLEKALTKLGNQIP